MYKTINNKDKEYTTTGGMSTSVSRPTEYSIYFVGGGHNLHVLDIKDHFINPKNIGEGICRELNKGNVVLDLK